MISANELRIGNWVTCGRDVRKFIQVESIDETGINAEVSGGYYVGEHETDYDGYFEMEWHNSALVNPIPLTPQILEKAGFTDNKTRLVGCPNDIIEWEYGDAEIRKEYGGYEYVLYSDEWGCNLKSITIQYLHQLQNLYFALTNQELNITL